MGSWPKPTRRDGPRLRTCKKGVQKGSKKGDFGGSGGGLGVFEKRPGCTVRVPGGGVQNDRFWGIFDVFGPFLDPILGPFWYLFGTFVTGGQLARLSVWLEGPKITVSDVWL